MLYVPLRFRSLGKLPDVELIVLAQGVHPLSEPLGSRAMEVMLDRYEPLMVKIMKQLGTHSDAKKDALQAAREGCIKAIHKFDVSRGVRFSSYAWSYIKGAVHEVVYVEVPRRISEDELKERRERREANGKPSDEHRQVSLPENVEKAALGGVLIDDTLASHGLRLDVRRFVESLSARQRYLVLRIFWDDASRADVAHELGISRSAVTQAVNGILRAGMFWFDEQAA